MKTVCKILSDADINDAQLNLLVQQYLYNPSLFQSKISLESSIASLNDSQSLAQNLENLFEAKILPDKVQTTIERLKHSYNVAHVDNALDADKTGFASYVLQFLGRVTSNIKIIHQ